MSQLSGLNQASPKSQVEATTDSKVLQGKTAKLDVSVGKDLLANFTLAGSNTTLTKQLTLAQAKLLTQQPLQALLLQQSALVFSQSQTAHTSLSLPANLSLLLQQWLASDQQRHTKLPKELAQLLMTKLGMSADQVQNQILQAQLKQSLLQLQFLQGEPLLEIKYSQSPVQQSQEQLQNLIQFMLPIALQDNESALVQYQQSQDQGEQEQTLSFKMLFDLAKLGKLEVEIELTEFSLNSRCICHSPLLTKKVERYWPLLEQRLSKLGFTAQNQITTKSRLNPEQDGSQALGVIDIKV